MERGDMHLSTEKLGGIHTRAAPLVLPKSKRFEPCLKSCWFLLIASLKNVSDAEKEVPVT